MALGDVLGQSVQEFFICNFSRGGLDLAAETPFRRLHRLYEAMRAVEEESIGIVDATVQGEGLGKKEEWREHLKVHRQGGKPCPRCGSEIKSQVRSGSETNYCVVCQPLFE